MVSWVFILFWISWSYLPSVCLLWGSVCLNCLPNFLWGCLCSFCWALRVICIFWIQVLCQICGLWIFSPSLFIFFLSFFGHTMWHVELPWPGIEPVPLAVEAGSLNHWTTREVHLFIFLTVSFIGKKVLILMKANLSICFFYQWYFWCHS